MINEEILRLARQIWDYHRLGHSLENADCILVLGSHDFRVADRGAELWLEGMAPWLVFSGGLGNFTREVWKESEADQFARLAMEKGVPRENILIENKSTNTGENIHFTRALLESKGLDPQRFILVQKPYMERRAFATFMKQWPGKEVRLSSPQVSFEDYPTADIPMEKVIHIMLGDLQRIRVYPAKGFQIEQDIPPKVWEAYEKLVSMGFGGHLVKD